jgi:tRNA (mo5U34)-methyltransferase
MSPEEIKQTVARYKWYHKMDLGGVITPGHDFDAIWNNIRLARKNLDYAGRAVLDLGSVDGMWAFEAEKLGAAPVVATDCYYEQVYERFLFCREVLGSKVIPYYNVSPYDLWERLDFFFQENWGDGKPYQRRFDIVQHLGLLYHLRDPLRSLSQARSVLRTGGHILIETAAVVDEDGAFLLFNGVTPGRGRIYTDTTTWWAPTIRVSRTC